MRKKEEKQLPLWAQTGHQKPVTRRDFLASGLIPFTASLLVPNWVNLLLPSSAAAATAGSCAVQQSGMIPLITLNLAGGAGLQANFVPHTEGGELLPSYDLMGLGDNQLPIEREFGNVPFAGSVNGRLISRFLQGVRGFDANGLQLFAPNAIPNTAFVGVCVRSRDDSNSNRFSIDGLASKAGLVGSQLPNLGRTSNTVTGINIQPAILTPPAPLVVGSTDTITGALGYSAAVGTSLNRKQKRSLANLISSLSDSQSKKLLNLRSGKDVKKVLDCAGIRNIDLVSSESNVVDPRQDVNIGAQLSTLWGINANTAANNTQLVFASMAYNVLKGHAGAGGLELGGYDYHNNTRTTGDAQDLVAGQTVGRLLETAFLMNQPLFLYVTSDGSVSSAKSNDRNSVWTSDRGAAGVAYMLFFDPKGRRGTTNFQLGHFTAGQAADDKFITGNSAELAAAAVFANYLHLNGKVDLFSQIATRSLEPKDISKVIRFA